MHCATSPKAKPIHSEIMSLVDNVASSSPMDVGASSSSSSSSSSFISVVTTSSSSCPFRSLLVAKSFRLKTRAMPRTRQIPQSRRILFLSESAFIISIGDEEVLMDFILVPIILQFIIPHLHEVPCATGDEKGTQSNEASPSVHVISPAEFGPPPWFISIWRNGLPLEPLSATSA